MDIEIKFKFTEQESIHGLDGDGPNFQALESRIESFLENEIYDTISEADLNKIDFDYQ